MTVDQPVIVTGCQRSGTNITAHILGNARQYITLEDTDWIPTQEHISTLKNLVVPDSHVDLTAVPSGVVAANEAIVFSTSDPELS